MARQLGALAGRGPLCFAPAAPLSGLAPPAAPLALRGSVADFGFGEPTDAAAEAAIRSASCEAAREARGRQLREFRRACSARAAGVRRLERRRLERQGEGPRPVTRWPAQGAQPALDAGAAPAAGSGERRTADAQAEVLGGDACGAAWVRAGGAQASVGAAAPCSFAELAAGASRVRRGALRRLAGGPAPAAPAAAAGAPPASAAAPPPAAGGSVPPAVCGPADAPAAPAEAPPPTSAGGPIAAGAPSATATQQEEEDRQRSQGHPGRGLRVLETQEEVRGLLSGKRVLHVKGFGSGFGDPAREPSAAEQRQDETAAQAIEGFRPDYLVVDGDPWGSGFQRYVKAYADRQAGAGLAVPELVWVKNVKGSSPTPEEREKRLGQAREWADQGLPVVVSWLPEVAIAEGVDRLFGAGCWERLQEQRFDFRGVVRLLEVPAPQQPVWLRALRGTAPGREMFKAIEAVESRAGKQYFEKCSFENAAKGNAIYQHLRGAGPKPAAQGAVSFGGGESVLLEFATLYLFPGSGFDAEQAALFAFGRGRPDDPALPAHEGRAFRSQATAKRAPGANPGVRAALLRAAAAAKIHDMTEERAGPVASSPGAGAPSEQSSRYTSSLLSLQLQQYARRGRPPPALCPCVPQPSRAPCAGSDGYVSPDPAWEAYVQKVALPASHAYNCELSRGPQQLQRQVLMMSRGE